MTVNPSQPQRDPPQDTKEAFKQDMAHLYPDGAKSLHPEQVRDMAFVYCMGWCSSIAATRDAEALTKWLSDYAYTSEQGWMPDESWYW